MRPQVASPALKGRDNSPAPPERHSNWSSAPDISPFQGFRASGACFLTQAVGLGFVISPLWGFNSHCHPRVQQKMWDTLIRRHVAATLFPQKGLEFKNLAPSSAPMHRDFLSPRERVALE